MDNTLRDWEISVREQRCNARASLNGVCTCGLCYLYDQMKIPQDPKRDGQGSGPLTSPFEKETREFVESILDFFFRKNNDYGAGETNPLANFYEAAERLDLTPLQVWGVYFDKHLQAVHKYVANGRVESEPIEGRIQDCIGYLLLLRALIQDGK